MALLLQRRADVLAELPTSFLQQFKNYRLLAHHIRRASDSCAKHAGPRVQHSRIKKTGFRWNV